MFVDYCFRFWNPEKNIGNFNFEAPSSLEKLSIPEFINKACESRIKFLKYFEQFSKSSFVYNSDNTSNNNDNSNDKKSDNNENIRYKRMDFESENVKSKFYYLQTNLGESIPELMSDYYEWNAMSFTNFAKKQAWGALTANLLLIGMAGCLTPLHFDEQENIFLQLFGCKEVCLFNQHCSNALYSFPYGHACDRQSMINAEFPFINDKNIHNKYNASYFNKNSNAKCYRAVLQPGDSLYIPSGWWHEFVNLNDFATSVTFWSVPRAVNEKNSIMKNMDLEKV